ncbi:MAG TPA: NnrS family protein [Candidatus Omnitrophica bacterium]|nr:NnrS family protein [Candidatus Omnitrophota bacterium]HCI44303.1 NnrS family protein [Candidatus Omnitrophota bacterium]
MNKTSKACPVVLQTGFRIFFLGAAAYAVLSMAFWFVFYVAGGNIFVAMPLTVWHGHEMIFGFTMAVVAGFLLTAVINWTGLPTLSGRPLLILFLFWAAARVFAFMPASFPLWPMALCDTAFLVFLSGAVMRPIIAARQWRQSAVFSKLILVLSSGVVFYGALFHADLKVERKALRFAVYMVVSLIFTISRRVLPFFIERGAGYPVTLRNSRTLDLASLVFLIAFSIIDVFWNFPVVVAVLCALLVVVHTLRLSGWYTPGIWRKPLLWVLFVGYAFLIMGFFLKIPAAIYHLPDDSALHALTAGGIGIFTLGMMARVAWGHTGRNIAQAPRQLPFIFVPLIAGAMVRVLSPVLDGSKYALWIASGQILWMLAFGLYLFLYFRILISPRPDGRWG